MGEIVFGAYYENGVVYIEAFDLDQYLDLNMRFVSPGTQDVNSPTQVEKDSFKAALKAAISALTQKYSKAHIHYQGPSKSQHGQTHKRSRYIKDLSQWAEFVLDELKVLNGVDFKQKDKSSKPISGKSRHKGVVKKVGPDFLAALDYVTNQYVNSNLNAKSKHAFAAALELGNAKPAYVNWIKRFEKYRIRNSGQRVSANSKKSIAQKVANIPF